MFLLVSGVFCSRPGMDPTLVLKSPRLSIVNPSFLSLSCDQMEEVLGSLHKAGNLVGFKKKLWYSSNRRV